MVTKEQQARDYAAARELPLISVGMPEESVTVDGRPTPIQGTTGCRLSVVNWLRSEGWGQLDEIVEDDGQIGRVTWTQHDDGIWEATRIEWSEIASRPSSRAARPSAPSGDPDTPSASS